MRKLLWISFIASLIGFSAFGSLYIFRAQLYAKTEIVPASLGELYSPSPSTLAISQLDLGKNAVHITFNGLDRCSTWSAFTDGQTMNPIHGHPVVLPLTFGMHDYELHPQDCGSQSPLPAPVRLSIYFAPKETFGAQNVSIDQIQINHSSLPIWSSAPLAPKRWVPEVHTRRPLEAQAALKMLHGAGLDDGWSTRQKIAFIATFVRNEMPGGTPDARLNTLSPFTVFKEAQAGRAKSFCRQWSLGYGFFANAAGIPTRNVFTGGAMDRIDMASHAFSESYVEEDGVWALVDPTNAIAYVESDSGLLLSGADVYMATVSGTFDGLNARMIGDRNAFKPFADVSKDLRSFMHRNNFLIFIGSLDGRYQLDGAPPLKYIEKLWRFIAQPQQYFGYMPLTSFHWLRPASLIMGLAFGFIFVTVSAVRIRQSTTSHHP